jgi:large subunit ribosomal protein L18
MSATLQKRSEGRSVAGTRVISRNRRHFRLRKKISGTPVRPRLVVSRSLRQIYAQVIDDVAGVTIVGVSSQDPELKGATGTKSEIAAKVGALVAQRAAAKGVSAVVFDRGGNAYGGRIAKLADAAREGGLQF